MESPVRWCWRSRPAASVRSSKAAPPAAGVRFVVPEASTKMTVLRLSGHGRRHGVVSWYAWTRAPCSVEAHGVVSASSRLRVA